LGVYRFVNVSSPLCAYKIWIKTSGAGQIIDFSCCPKYCCNH
jgi:hypothetical protein